MSGKLGKATDSAIATTISTASTPASASPPSHKRARLTQSIFALVGWPAWSGGEAGALGCAGIGMYEDSGHYKNRMPARQARPGRLSSEHDSEQMFSFVSIAYISFTFDNVRS